MLREHGTQGGRLARLSRPGQHSNLEVVRRLQESILYIYIQQKIGNIDFPDWYF